MEAEEGAKCDRCNEQEPAIACLECSSLLCQFCYDNHRRRNKRFHSNDVVPLTEISSDKGTEMQSEVKILLCKDHNSLL